MKETCELRVVEEFASRLFDHNEGNRLGGTVRQIVIPTDDPRYQAVGRLQKETRTQTGRSFFYGWRLKRCYSTAELDLAECFRLSLVSTFEPAGEELGTKYDESTACPLCGAGAKQISTLCLPVKNIPKSKDISQTIAGEIIVSRRMREAFVQYGITGVELLPIRTKRNSYSVSKEWYQLTIPNAKADICSLTRVGVDPFDEDENGEFRCPLGDLIGLNLLSELFLVRETVPGTDFVLTRQFIGTRRGLLRPQSILLVSQKVRRLIDAEQIKGIELEVAHLVRTKEV